MLRITWTFGMGTAIYSVLQDLKDTHELLTLSRLIQQTIKWSDIFLIFHSKHDLTFHAIVSIGDNLLNVSNPTSWRKKNKKKMFDCVVC